MEQLPITPTEVNTMIRVARTLLTRIAWLHHVVMLAAGPNRKDNVCGRWLLPGERFFSSGNERTPTAFGDVLTRKVKSVFVLTPQDSELI
jgi:hypothetical protein